MHKKVKFKGETYWLTTSTSRPGGYLLSPLSHFSESGEFVGNPFRDISYAVIEEDGTIVRFHEDIGMMSDLVDVVNEETEK